VCQGLKNTVARHPGLIVLKLGLANTDILIVRRNSSLVSSVLFSTRTSLFVSITKTFEKYHCLLHNSRNISRPKEDKECEPVSKDKKCDCQ
jgi:hypothetical protein